MKTKFKIIIIYSNMISGNFKNSSTQYYFMISIVLTKTYKKLYLIFKKHLILKLLIYHQGIPLARHRKPQFYQ